MKLFLIFLRIWFNKNKKVLILSPLSLFLILIIFLLNKLNVERKLEVPERNDVLFSGTLINQPSREDTNTSDTFPKFKITARFNHANSSDPDCKKLVRVAATAAMGLIVSTNTKICDQ